jgi:hypothetical protein
VGAHAFYGDRTQLLRVLRVRGKLVVLAGETAEGDVTSSVERLSSAEDGGAFVDLPPLSCGGINGAAAVAVDSAAGQVLLLGGVDEG